MKRRHLFILPSIICIILLAAGGFFIFEKLPLYLEKKRVLIQYATADYQSVFLSMYDVSTFPDEVFTVNKGIPTLKSDYYFRSTRELNDALRNVFSSGNNITNIFLGLDPFSFRRSGSAEQAVLAECTWLTYIDENPQVPFEILFSFPSMDYWISISEAERDRAFALYERLVYLLDAKSNVTMYYVGGEDWLICNPANYINSFAAKRDVSEKIFLYTFCDGYFKITADNAPEMLQQTRARINAEIASPAEYPDLSQYDIVLMGDSILGLNTGNLAIAEIIGSFSGASVFNCAQGGTCAAELAPEALCFPKIAAEFLAGQPAVPDSVYGQGILKYVSAEHSEKRTCFLINFGVNDYFNGLPPKNTHNPYDVLTYTGALRTGITALQEHYPDALYIIMGPGQVTIFERGTELLNGKDSLYDYSAAAAGLATELGVSYLNLYQDFPEGNDKLNDVLLGDGVHYNEHGRFVLSRKIMAFISEIDTVRNN